MIPVRPEPPVVPDTAASSPLIVRPGVIVVTMMVGWTGEPPGVKRPLRGAATVASGCAVVSSTRLRHRASLPRSGKARPLDPALSARSHRRTAEQGWALLRSGAVPTAVSVVSTSSHWNPAHRPLT